MPLLSESAENDALSACYGDGHAAHWPASFTLHLFDDDPREGGVELGAAGGYASVVVANTSANFPAPTAGVITGTAVAFPVSTGAWSAAARWWVLKNGASLVEGGELDEPVTVAASGASISVSPSIFYNDF